MAPSDNDDAQRVPDADAPDDAGPSELPAGPAPRAIEPRRGDGVDPRPSGAVVFDVEVDDPSLVIPRPSRRARPKPSGEAPIEESDPAVAELAGPEADGIDQDHDDDDLDDDADEAEGGDDHDAPGPPRQLVSGDPLLTGPIPVVRPAPRASKRTASARTVDEPAPTVPPAKHRAEPPASEAPDEARPAADNPVEPPSSADPPPRPPLSPKDLFEPVTGEHATVDADIPDPPPAPAATGSGGPPPPPAPTLATAGTPGPGIARATPPPPGGPTVPPARRASRGSQVTGPIPTTAVPRQDASGPVPAPRPTAVAPSPRLAGRRPRVRRVTRVVRHVDPWSVFKVAVVFSFVAYGIALVAGVLLWNVAYATGTVDNIERGLESTGWETFELNGGEIFHNAWIGGLFAAVGLTGLAVLVATLFNLITDLVGGVRMTVLEEEVVEKTSSPMRRFSSRKAPDPVPPPNPPRR